MNILYDYERLVSLLSSLYTLSGIRADLYDRDFREIYLPAEQVPRFCTLINGCPEGNRRCLDCDREAQNRARAGRPIFYRCHAGICESILSICEGSEPLAYMFFGQYLDDTNLEEQWENTRRTLDWYPGDLEQLHQAFLEMRRYSQKEIDAYAEILTVLASHIRLEGLIQSAGQTDLQRLERYLEEHYTEKLSLDSVAAALGMGRTKLCALAKELSGGSTLSKMITQRRIDAARDLLRKSDVSVSSVAEAVGISDYNYFTKVFRAATGTTPTEYRRLIRREQPGKTV